MNDFFITKIVLVLLLALFGVQVVEAQNREVNFQHSTLDEALQQAREQDKLIFIDCYTSWCGPCKMMAKTVFTLDSVADFVNQSFIPLKLDMEVGEGPEVGKRYAVQAYPTYLFLNGKGELIYKFVGGMKGDRFIDSARVALEPANRFRLMNERYASGNYDDAFMRDFIRLKFKVSEFEEAVSLADQYFNKLSPDERALPENWMLFGESSFSSRIAYSNSRNLNYLVEHWAYFKGQVDDSLLYGRISDNFVQITANTFNGRYFRDNGRNCADFDAFKIRIKRVEGLVDRPALLVLMDVAKAVCVSDTALALQLLTDHVSDFSAANQKALFDFFGFYLNADQIRTHVVYELMRRIVLCNRNPNLVGLMKYYMNDADPNVERYDVPNLENKIGSTTIIPFFHPEKQVCYFGWTEPGGKSEFKSYEAGKGTRSIYNKMIIDSLLLAEGIDTSWVSLYPSFDEQGLVASFTAGGQRFAYDSERKSIEKIPEKQFPPVLWGLSPDKKFELFEQNYNLFSRNLGDSSIVQLTNDGEAKAAYQLSEVKWISDSKFVISKNDTRGVRQMSVINSTTQPYPTTINYDFQLPGDQTIDRTEVYIGDVAKGEIQQVDVERWEGQQLYPVRADEVNDRFYFMRIKRTRKEIELCYIDRSGECKGLVHEVCEPVFNEMKFACKILNKGEDILFWSDRTGWGHYYRYDKDGKLKNSLGTGNWTAGRIAGFDQKTQQVFYSCYEREKGINPNYKLLYRVDLDGKNAKLLTPENADHNVFVNISGNMLIDNYSRIDTAPRIIARTCSGNLLDTVATPDIQPLLDYGWKFPEQFTVKAADGKTDLYGIIWKPFDFDPNEKYPVVSQVYPGPFTETVWTNFTVLDRYNNTALAQRGVIVVCMGHRGSAPHRGKAYSSYGHGNLRDYPIADDKYGLEQLARRYNFIDSTRVGIVGHSGGALMSVVAMCTYPDFYKVAVASSGNYDNYIYHRNWGEYYQGIGEDNSFSVKTAMELALNLKGKLLLATGESDINVNPANTYRMVDALIKAEKDFDLLVLPGQGHHFEGPYKTYFENRKRDYFTKYLINRHSGN
ncbi:DPP IV N-terminal domain-containing protein [Mangrovibacterium diazotrophicum]|uniref:Thioredoxin-like protein n=1 Tax=Mangrovibacterium diazotrophicum TaxID=1261403 RepID=A0A419WAV3_9BACT|nr:DPP IV N-terminal domain-containing protein [Mangrovibacterium diazotrophicum]RKD92546.1 thioredoxin-like protein [Mangrovibacterium diazotrophicum]